jgi:alpha-beta hydrolase superfamily lysophospholipase
MGWHFLIGRCFAGSERLAAAVVGRRDSVCATRTSSGLHLRDTSKVPTWRAMSRRFSLLTIAVASLCAALLGLAPATAEAHTSFAGRYRQPNGCEWVVSASVRRLWLRDTCTHEWRALEPQGDVWLAGDRVLHERGMPAKSTRYRFARVGDARTLTRVNGAAGDIFASDSTPYTLTEVSVRSGKVTLAGHVYWPKQASGEATVMLHGSGPQDRNGYASIIAVLADALAQQGHVVLAFDKRGSGSSTGDGELASFADLARDAIAAQKHLANLLGTPTSSVGFAGSSQAGWVAAMALSQGSTPSHVMLLGAAGAAVDVPHQNTYNTQVRMRCAGFGEDAIAKIGAQHTTFYRHLQSREHASAAALHAASTAVPWRARAWSMPRELDFASSSREWFRVLEMGFDPLPLWREYSGRLVLIFAEHDDSTPTRAALSHWKALNQAPRQNVRIHILPQAQHLGLSTGSLCAGELSQLTAFAPQLWQWWRL